MADMKSKCTLWLRDETRDRLRRLSESTGVSQSQLVDDLVAVAVAAAVDVAAAEEDA